MRRSRCPRCQKLTSRPHTSCRRVTAKGTKARLNAAAFPGARPGDRIEYPDPQPIETEVIRDIRPLPEFAIKRIEAAKARERKARQDYVDSVLRSVNRGREQGRQSSTG